MRDPAAAPLPARSLDDYRWLTSPEAETWLARAAAYHRQIGVGANHGEVEAGGAHEQRLGITEVEGFIGRAGDQQEVGLLGGLCPPVVEALEQAGVIVSSNPASVGETVERVLKDTTRKGKR